MTQKFTLNNVKTTYTNVVHIDHDVFYFTSLLSTILVLFTK